MTLTYASVCSGVEAASLAWGPLGWRPLWFSEIDPAPSAVLAGRWPQVPNLGDMTAIDPEEALREHGRPDVFVGGTPCQAFSAAGLRRGLDDPRGNLPLAFLRLAAALRPRWLVWENVPGVLSKRIGPEVATRESADGGGVESVSLERDPRDGGVLGAFYWALGELGFRWAGRVLDAQYFGLAQRRKRLFVVGRLGVGPHPGAVLFEPACLRGDPAPRREAGAGVAALTAAGVGTCGAYDNQAQAGHLIAFDGAQVTSHLNRSNPQPGDPCHPLHRGEPPTIAFHALQDPISTEETALPLQTDGFAAGGLGFTDRNGVNVSEGVMPTLDTLRAQNGVQVLGTVRRLMPVECERLQGMPDGHTRIPWRGKPAEECPDGPRHKAIGNSMAVPVMAWIGQRIQLVEDAWQTRDAV